MKYCTIIIALALSLLLIACGNGDQTRKTARKSSATQPASHVEPQQLPGIHIYRYGDFPVAKAKQLKAELEKAYPSVSLADEAIELPKACYYKPRDRYRGTGLLDDLMKLRNGCYVLGMTNKIIYDENEISPTFGIFGISYQGDSVSVISSLRPKTLKPLSDDEMHELMLHELGHAFGLPHCKDEHCIMVDAEHGNKFAHTQSFCTSCRNYLNNKGWTLR